MVGGSTVDYAGTHARLTSLLSILGALGFLLLAACRRAPAPAPKDAALEVTFSGCAAVVAREDSVTCQLGDSRVLRLVGAPERAIFEAVRYVPSHEAETRLLSTRFVGTTNTPTHQVDVPFDVDELVVRAERDGRPARFTLHVATARKIPWIDEAKSARANGNRAHARSLAEAHVGAPDDAERAAAKDLLARIALSEGHAEEAFPLFRAAIESHRAARRLSDEIDDSFALAFALHQRSHRYDEARAALDDVAKVIPLYPEGAARAPYYRGILASETGDARSALRLLRDAELLAARLGMSRLDRNARAARALEMQVLGRSTESVTLLETLERDVDVKGCERVEIANDLGWGYLLANEENPERPRGDPRPMLRAALADPSCTDAYLRSFALGNLATFEASTGNVTAAEEHLAAAQAAVKEPRGTERLAWLDLEARILLAKHDGAKALARFDEELALARAGLFLEREWRALVGRSDALQALARRSEAVSALVAAEELLDRAILLVPLGEGRGSFVAERSRSARGAIELLVSLGRNEDAANVARRSRTRVLASVERSLRIEELSSGDRARWEAAVRAFRSAREAIDADAASDWKLPADALRRAMEVRKQREQELHVALESAMAVLTRAARADAEAAQKEPIAAGDLELVIHPGTKDWIVFAADAKRTTAHRVPDPFTPSAELAHALFDPIKSRLLAARRVRVRAYGKWRWVHVHALEIDGVPLLAKVAVDYPLGLRGAAGDVTFDRRALVVGDPDGTLVASRAEATFVAKAVSARMPTTLLIGNAATSKAVASALPRAGFFHYAGHAVVDSRTWSSRLELEGGGRLTVGDLFSLTPAPRRAVLLGCSAGRSFDEHDALGLAHALIAAGTEEVLAPVDQVSDGLAKNVAEALYAGAAGDAALDLDAEGSLAVAARLALLRVREQDPAADWKAFRVLAR